MNCAAVIQNKMSQNTQQSSAQSQALHQQQLQHRRQAQQLKQMKLLSEINKQTIPQQPQIISGASSIPPSQTEQQLQQHLHHRRSGSSGGSGCGGACFGSFHSRESSMGIVNKPPHWEQPVTAAGGGAGGLSGLSMDNRSRQSQRYGIASANQIQHYNTMVGQKSGSKSKVESTEQKQNNYASNATYSQLYPTISMKADPELDTSTLVVKVEKLERDLDHQKQLNNELINRILMLEQRVSAESESKISRSGSVVHTNTKKRNKSNVTTNGQSIHLRNQSDIHQLLKQQLQNIVAAKTGTQHEEAAATSSQLNSNGTANIVSSTGTTDHATSKANQMMSQPRPIQSAKGIYESALKQNEESISSQIASSFLTQKGQDFFKQKQSYHQRSNSKKRSNSSLGGIKQFLNMMQGQSSIPQDNSLLGTSNTIDTRMMQTNQSIIGQQPSNSRNAASGERFQRQQNYQTVGPAADIQNSIKSNPIQQQPPLVIKKLPGTIIKPQNITLKPTATGDQRCKSSNIYLTIGQRNPAVKIQKPEISQLPQPLIEQQQISRQQYHQQPNQQNTRNTRESKSNSWETNDQGGNQAASMMETLITYEQDDEPTPKSSTSSQNSFTDKLLQTLKQKIQQPKMHQIRNRDNFQDDSEMIHQTVMHDRVSDNAAKAKDEAFHYKIGGLLYSNECQPPEAIEKYMIMERIFLNNQQQLMDTRDSQVETPLLTVKGTHQPTMSKSFQFEQNQEKQYKLLNQIEILATAKHQLKGKQSLIPRLSLRSHFDSVREIKFCDNGNKMVSVSEDCMMKLWDVKQLIVDKIDHDIQPLYTFRGHTGPLFALATNHGKGADDSLIYSAGSEGVIRVWKLPTLDTSPEQYQSNGGINHCLGVFSSHKDVVWQLVHHPQDNMLLSVSADASVKLWKQFDMHSEGISFESIEQCTNHSLMGSFIQKRESGVQEVPTSAAWLNTHPNMLVISYRNPLICMFDRITGGKPKGIVNLDIDPSISIFNQQINKIIVHPNMPLAITGHENKQIKLLDLNTMKCLKSSIAHSDSVTSLIVKDFTLTSGSHDGSIRVWDLRKLQLLYELPAHRKKFDESVFCITQHPSKKILVSGGADSVIKIFDSLLN